MQYDPDRKPLLDMLPDGRFRELRRPRAFGPATGAARMETRLAGGVVTGAALAGVAALLAVLATFMAALIPVAIAAALLGRATIRVRRGRA